MTTSSTQFLIGCIIWAVGFWGNLYHEHILRKIRVKGDKLATKSQVEQEKTVGDSDRDVKIVHGRIYVIPKGGLFEYILFPHVCMRLPLTLSFGISSTNIQVIVLL